jgi:hypothetical protein
MNKFIEMSDKKTFADILVFGIILPVFFLMSVVGIVSAGAPAIANPAPPATPVRLVFIHHSTGENWLSDDNGGLGIALRDSNYFVSDTNYGWGPDVIGDRTDLGNWWEWFRGPNSTSYLSTLYGEGSQTCAYSRLDTAPAGNNEIIMFKSCFPNSALQGSPDSPVPPIESNPLKGMDAWSGFHTVANAKGIYNDILEYFRTRQDKLFIVITAPPLSDPAYSSNARAFNEWLVHDWLKTYPYRNVAVFDFYNVLTTNGGTRLVNDLGQEAGNHHRWRNNTVQHITDGDNDQLPDISEYFSSPGDDHPNQAGNLKATGEYLPLLNIAYHCWKGTGDCPDILTPLFSDVPADYWARFFIRALSNNNISAGCMSDDPGTPGNEARFCPEAIVTRSQMAVFLLKALGQQPAAACTGLFDDVNVQTGGNEVFCRYIEKFSTLGITAGCGSNNFCPNDPVSRMQMAVFITKALGETPGVTCGGTFDDVNETTGGNAAFCKYIEKFSILGITAGCGTGIYCPLNPVSRAQMAVFLTKGFLLQNRVQPQHFQYLGAFRLPGDDTRPMTFSYGGNAMTYNPAGDPGGAPDGFPGSLFITGHDRLPYGELPDGSQLAEVSIPAPIITKNPSELDTAVFLQSFSDMSGGLFDTYDEIPRIGIQYLSAAATGPRIHIAWGQHFHEGPEDQTPTHAWCSPNLSAPDAQGAWHIGNQSLYSVNGYMFEIPSSWADANAGGKYLGTGRYRDGGWSGQGPSLFAYRPWTDGLGTPAAPGASLQETVLLLYEKSMNTEDVVNMSMAGYQHPDEWEGGAWITTSTGKTGVLFAGTKSAGQKYWYGWINPAGPEFPCVETEMAGDFILCRLADGSPCPAQDLTGCTGHTDYRGWWTSRFEARFILYDPSDLTRVAAGQMNSWDPQPYASLGIDEHLLLNPDGVEPEMLGTGQQRRFRIGSVAYDRANDLLYVLELFADGIKPVIHIWRVR